MARMNPIRIAARLAFAVAALLVAGAAGAAKITLDVAPSSGMLLAGKRQPAYLKVGLRGECDRGRPARPKLNAALVLDKSGSMTGEKIARAKEAARVFVEGLAPDDIVSIIAYDTVVSVLLPATKAGEKEEIFAAIAAIRAGGSTALFAGVSKGAAEARKFLEPGRVNRIVLLSDGLANVGPSTPSDLAALGRSLIKEGLSVTTIGLGLDYNEDLMTQLAAASDGNHAFVENSADLARIFKNELGATQLVVAQEIIIKIKIAVGVRPVRVLGRDAEIDGQTVHVKLNSLYDGYDRNVVIEIEPPLGEPGQRIEIASATAEYRDMDTNEMKKAEGRASVGYTASASEAEAASNPAVMVPVVTLIAAEQNQLATKLRDEGKVEEARDLLLKNSEYIGRQNMSLKDESLKRQGAVQLDDAKSLAPGAWQARRKMMREEQGAAAADSYRLKK